jgi:drug/metabolite transporter (DMT)-like permease
VQPALIKYALGGTLSELEAGASMLLAVAVLLGGWLTATGRLPRLSGTLITFGIIAGFLEYAGPLMLAFVAARHVDAGLLTLIMSTTPVFTVALAAAVGQEPLSGPSVGACLLGLLAMALIVLPEGALPKPEMLPWCLLAFAVPLLYATGSVWVSHNWPAQLDAMQAALAGALGSAVLLAPWWIGPVTSGALIDNPFWPSLVLAVLVVTVLVEMMMYMYLLRHAGAVFTSFTSFVTIAAGFAAGMILFGERPSLWIWSSVGLFVAALALVVMRRGTATAATL